MSEDQPNQETIRRHRVDLQLINHELDADPHNTHLWARKALAFEQAMIGTLPTRTRLERTLLWWEQCLPSTSWTTYYNCAAISRRLNRHEEALGYVRQALALEPGDPRPRELEAQTLQRVGLDYEERLRRGEMTFVLEAADPDLFTLQIEVDELTSLGLTKAAEDLCTHFEISHGPTNLTRSKLMQLKVGPQVQQPLLPGEITGAYPLLEIARSHVPEDFVVVVDRIVAEGKAADYFPLDEVNDFDEQIRWLLSHAKDPFNINDPMSAFKPRSSLWHMAALNFVVARRFGHPLFLAYAATTLADFYATLGKSELPFILYTVAAAAADRAGQADYAANAHGRCAAILMADGRIGPAIRRMRRALDHLDRARQVAPRNRYGLYRNLAECYEMIDDPTTAAAFYRKAADVEGIDEDLRKWALLGVDSGEIRVAYTATPPVRVHELPSVEFSFDTPHGPYRIMATSRHELYDLLLQQFDSTYKTRRSLTERKTGVPFLEGYAELLAELIRLAVQLGMPINSLTHLEAQKCIVLNDRLRYLTREKPPGIPEEIWEDLQRLMGVYRRMVEEVNEPDAAGELLADFSPLEVADTIGARIWECNKVSAEGTRRIQQKLALGKLPKTVECASPADTAILEYGPGVCFLIRPEDTHTIQAVELPGVEPETDRRLVAELMEIIKSWISHFSRRRDTRVCCNRRAF